MNVGTLFIYVTILVIMSPAIWVAWWLVADLGEKVTGSADRKETWAARARRVA